MCKIWLGFTILWILYCLAGSATAAEKSTHARLAIIIDDIGYTPSLSYRAARLPGNFTLSILPFTPYARDAAQLALTQGKELMLHVPMSNMANLPLGAGGLYSGMEKEKFIATLRQNIANLPHIKGINNHMGSRLTQETEPMAWVMEELRKQDLYFVDSRTSANTKALDIARQWQIPSIKRDIFLDNIQEPEQIRRELNRAIQLAQQHGAAVAIGHPYPSTLSILENIQPLLLQQKVGLVPVSQLLTRQNFHPQLPPEIDIPNSYGYCAAPTFSILALVNSSVKPIGLDITPPIE